LFSLVYYKIGIYVFDGRTAIYFFI
jgi:hypothetical protein